MRVLVAGVPVLPEVRDAVPKCSHKRRVEGDNHSACWKCRVSFWGGLNELCSPDVRCVECVDVSDFIFEVVNKNIEKLTKRTEQRRNKSKDSSSNVTDDKKDLTLGLSESQFESLCGELDQSYHSVDILTPNSEGTCVAKGALTTHGKPELTSASFTAWFNVTELNPDQRDVVGQMITSFANQNRIARKREPYTAQLKPVFFQVTQSQKAPPPVTQAVSLTLLVDFTLGALRLLKHPYVTASSSPASRTDISTGHAASDATANDATAADGTTSDGTTTKLHATLDFARWHVRKG